MAVEAIVVQFIYN